MFKHIVMWKLKPEAAGKRAVENARIIKERFEELANMMDGLRVLEVGVNVIPGDDAADVALYTEFDSREAYQAYADHPAHTALVTFIRDVSSERRMIDYQT